MSIYEEEAPDCLALQGEHFADWLLLKDGLQRVGYATRELCTSQGSWVGLAGSNFSTSVLEWEDPSESGACALGWGNRTEVLVSVTDGNRLGATALMDALSSSAERVDVESGVWLVGGGLGVAPFPDDWAEPMESGGGPEEVERALAWIRLQSVGLSDGMKPFLPSGTPTRTGLPGWAARMDHILVSREGVDVVSAKVVGAIGERRSSTLLLEWERSARDATFQV